MYLKIQPRNYKTSANLRILAYNLVLLFETKGHELLCY